MMAHAQLAKAQLPQALFAALHLLQDFARHGAAILHARAQARRRWAIPYGVAGRPGKRAHLKLRQPGIGERR